MFLLQQIFFIIRLAEIKFKIVHVLTYLPCLDMAAKPNGKSGNSKDHFCETFQ
jgi:hypothetical protein